MVSRNSCTRRRSLESNRRGQLGQELKGSYSARSSKHNERRNCVAITGAANQAGSDVPGAERRVDTPRRRVATCRPFSRTTMETTLAAVLALLILHLGAWLRGRRHEAVRHAVRRAVRSCESSASTLCSSDKDSIQLGDLTGLITWVWLLIALGLLSLPALVVLLVVLLVIGPHSSPHRRPIDAERSCRPRLALD